MKRIKKFFCKHIWLVKGELQKQSDTMIAPSKYALLNHPEEFDRLMKIYNSEVGKEQCGECGNSRIFRVFKQTN